MGRARWSEQDQAWLAANPHGLPPDSPYRPAFVFASGMHRSTRKDPEPWKDVPRAEVDRWRMRNLDERWAATDRIAQCLTWLFLEFGGYDDPEGR